MSEASPPQVDETDRSSIGATYSPPYMPAANGAAEQQYGPASEGLQSAWLPAGVCADLARIGLLTAVYGLVGKLGLLLASVHLQVPGVGFRLLEDDMLVTAGIWGAAAELRSVANRQVGESLVGWVTRTGQPLIINDITTDKRVLAEHREVALQRGLLAFLGMPLTVGTQVIGVMNFHASGDRPFPEHDVELARAFADQATIVLHNAQLFADAERRRHKVATGRHYVRP